MYLKDFKFCKIIYDMDKFLIIQKLLSAIRNSGKVYLENHKRSLEAKHGKGKKSKRPMEKPSVYGSSQGNLQQKNLNLSPTSP